MKKTVFSQSFEKFKINYDTNQTIRIFILFFLTAISIYLSLTVSYWILILAIFLSILAIFLAYGIIKEFFEIYNDISNEIENLSDGNYKFSFSRYNPSTQKDFNVKNGKLDGSYKEYKSYGYGNSERIALDFECNYKDGVLHGVYRSYFENGNVKWQLNYEEGWLIGESLLYNDKGILLSRYDYTGDGIFDFIEYYENGNIRMKKESHNTDYLFTFYYENGTKACEIINDFFYYGDRIVGYARYNEIVFNDKISNKGIWTNYNKKGDVDYKLKFSSLNDSAKKTKPVLEVEKINYDKNGNEISSYILKYKYLKDSCFRFMSQYVESRLIFGKHRYDTGIKGPPGLGTGNVDIPLVNDITDLIEFIDEPKTVVEDNTDNTEVEIKIETSNLPESPIKSLDDLDPELRKKVEKHTVFVGEDGVLPNIDKDKKDIKNDIFCPKCGSKQNENKFCTNCGNKLVKN